MIDQTDFWHKAAPEHWENIGPPFRPSPQDSALMNYALRKNPSRYGSLKALILGVTPEMTCLDWPDGTDLLAVDSTREMIDTVWPGFPDPGKGALCANWLDLPLKKHSRDIVLGDGCINVLQYPNGYRELLRSIHRILQPGGIFVHRVFIRPDMAEKPDAVYESVLAGEINGFTAFKFRLWMSLQGNIEDGVRMGDVWNSWMQEGPGPKQLAEQTGWSPELINSIKYYRDKNFILSCPTLDELCNIMKEESFEVVDCKWPTYELGERCPTLTTQKINK